MRCGESFFEWSSVVGYQTSASIFRIFLINFWAYYINIYGLNVARISSNACEPLASHCSETSELTLLLNNISVQYYMKKPLTLYFLTELIITEQGALHVTECTVVRSSTIWRWPILFLRFIQMSIKLDNLVEILTFSDSLRETANVGCKLSPQDQEIM